MQYREIIVEAGVKTAEVDRAARAAITAQMTDLVEAIQEQAAPDIGTYEYDPDKENNASDYYDRFYQWANAHKEDATKSILKKLSEQLTIVVREMVSSKLNTESEVTVHMASREYDDNEKDTTWGGYYHQGYEGKSVIKVIIDGDKVLYAVLSVIKETIFGEDSENDAKILLDAVVPTFAHEYAHYVQNIRGKNFFKKDKGLIGWKGKRHDYHRHTKTDDQYLRYLGSLHEIDAWASSAASQIVQDMRERYGQDEEDFNERLTELRQSLAHGWMDSNAYDTYRRHYYNSLEGHFDGLDHREMTKVWQRFQRILYSKLGDYLHPTTGQAYNTTAKKMPPAYVQAAKTKTMPQTVAFLARSVVRSLRQQIEGYGADYVLKDVDRGGSYEGDQHKAETFIRTYYFGRNFWDREGQFERVIVAFRSLLKRGLMAEEQDIKAYQREREIA